MAANCYRESSASLDVCECVLLKVNNTVVPAQHGPAYIGVPALARRPTEDAMRRHCLEACCLLDARTLFLA